ncbi:citramalyl-CoA lyase, mitochondrial [Cephus cinctus]|uniref:Citramalyl-CoA lyase, mitochondrial n=1 Tax=Cephus cinctus TaxID=211228 RepID=A0AAJ7BN62_CEPCN|nr:citramalyl-CoA lyase, mitochondrial [Cephus cinctus]
MINMFLATTSRIMSRYRISAKYTRQMSFIPRRTLLYVPGCDERKIQKARSLDADLIALDCEDGVAINQKGSARQKIRELLDLGEFPKSRPEWGVRVNSVSSGLCDEDLKVILGGKNQPPCILLPKLDTVEEIIWFSDTVKKLFHNNNNTINLIVFSETSISMMNLPSIVQAVIDAQTNTCIKLVALVVGSDDYVADIGATRTKDCSEILYARQRLVMVAKAFGLQAIDMVHIDLQDLEGLQITSEQGASWGFTGRQIIHPSQVSIVHKAYSPTQKKVDWASKLIDAFDAHQKLGKGAFVFENQMIDMPTLKQAQNIVTLANLTLHHKD